MGKVRSLVRLSLFYFFHETFFPVTDKTFGGLFSFLLESTFITLEYKIEIVVLLQLLNRNSLSETVPMHWKEAILAIY